MPAFEDQLDALAIYLRQRPRRPNRAAPIETPPTRTGAGMCPACGSLDLTITGLAILRCRACGYDVTSYD